MILPCDWAENAPSQVCKMPYLMFAANDIRETQIGTRWRKCNAFACAISLLIACCRSVAAPKISKNKSAVLRRQTRRHQKQSKLKFFCCEARSNVFFLMNRYIFLIFFNHAKSISTPQSSPRNGESTWNRILQVTEGSWSAFRCCFVAFALWCSSHCSRFRSIDRSVKRRNRHTDFQLVTRASVPVFLASSFAFIAPIQFGSKSSVSLKPWVVWPLQVWSIWCLQDWSNGVARQVIERFSAAGRHRAVIMVIGLKLARLRLV